MPDHIARAGIDPIDTPASALALIEGVAGVPARHQTIVLMLDGRSLGSVIAVVDHPDPATQPGQPSPEESNDEVIEVARVFARAASSSRQRQLIIASIRPDGALSTADPHRWTTLSQTVQACGAHLREWFVIGTAVHYPRALAGDPSRWPC
jgi:hypothetical protein